jgi:hypothetical protein
VKESATIVTPWFISRESINALHKVNSEVRLHSILKRLLSKKVRRGGKLLLLGGRGLATFGLAILS